MKLRELLLPSILVISCGREDSRISSAEYRLAAPSSAGLTWRANNDTIRVCYSDSTNSEKHKSDVIFSVKQWINAIEDESEPIAENVELVPSNAECDAKVWVGNYAPAFTQMGARPQVYINYAGWFGSKTVTLHEFGHAFGLLDTYAGSGGSCQNGQPDSVMCRASYDELMPDDIAGMRKIYKNVKESGGVRTQDALEGKIVYSPNVYTSQ